ncbi:MAG: hypothetical protein NTZ34_04395, partial [Chloroflexi bacterium]|nr:hypothetical protein [Chloroflexota bacterium]
MKNGYVAGIRNCLFLFLMFVAGMLAIMPAGQPVYASEKNRPPEAPALLQADPPKAQSIMYMTAEQARQENAEGARLPRAYIDSKIQRDLQANSDGTSLSLLSYIQYTPTERYQGNCGDCWVWASTGCLEVALNVQRGIKDRLSEQYFNSNYNSGTGNSFSCCGGSAATFAGYYNSTLQKAIPWSNLNAGFADASRICGSSTAMPATSIATTPNYPMSSCAAYQINTHGVGQATAIANIKNVLNQNKAVYLSMKQADHNYWNAFYNFWNTQGESVVWTGGYSCNATWNSAPGEGGSHAILCVGYNDTAATPYWLILNSWGTTANRPNGLFEIPMNYDYDCSIINIGYATNWYTVEPTFTVAPVAPTLMYPTAGATVSGTSITFQWNASTGATATNYWLAVINTATSSYIINQSVGNVTSYNLTGLANNGTQYKWAVAAGNSAGWSAGTAYYTFTSGTAAVTIPATPILSYPANGATLTGTSTTLQWNASAGATATNYWLAVINTATNSYIINQSVGNVTSYNLTGLANNGTQYKWAVAAGSSAGWSAGTAYYT